MNYNRGTGAGGSKTTFNGSSFEKLTSVENKSVENKSVENKFSEQTKVIFNKKHKYGYYIEFCNNNNKIIYLTQSGLKTYFKKFYDIDIYKQPDEAFITFSNNEINIKILEKKIKMSRVLLKIN